MKVVTTPSNETSPPTKIRPGCCVDFAKTRNGVCEGADGDRCMILPEGKTCGDCSHVRRCTSIFGAKVEDTWCGFHPRRFHLRVAE